MRHASTMESDKPKSRFVRPDAKGRIGLGKQAEGVSKYEICEQPGGALLLIPMVEIPAREQWLWRNKAALESVKEGLKQSSQGETVDRGSFAQFIDEEE